MKVCVVVLAVVLLSTTVIGSFAVPTATMTEAVAFHRNRHGDVHVSGVTEITETALVPGTHGPYVPKALARILQGTGVGNLSITWARGRWHDGWGFQRQSVAPYGVMLACPVVDDATWEVLMVSLGSTFSAGFPSLVPRDGQRYALGVVTEVTPTDRVAFLVDDAVCTENIAPWSLLQPCRGALGVSAVSTARRVLGAPYHSFGIHHRKLPSGAISLTYEFEFVEHDDMGRLPYRVVPCPLSSHTSMAVGQAPPVTVTSPRTVTPSDVPQADADPPTDGAQTPEITSSVRGDPIAGMRLSVSVRGLPQCTHGEGCVLWVAIPRRVLRPYVHTTEVVVPEGGTATYRAVEGYVDAVNLAVAFTAPSVSVVLEVATVFLHVDDYHPDANRAVFVPPPFVVTSAVPAVPVLFGHPVPLDIPSPDFSMVFNVIVLTCVGAALLYGSMDSVIMHDRLGQS